MKRLRFPRVPYWLWIRWVEFHHRKGKTPAQIKRGYARHHRRYERRIK